MKKHVLLYIDGSIPITDVARALGALGYTISSTTNGELTVSKRRNRKVEPRKPDKK